MDGAHGFVTEPISHPSHHPNDEDQSLPPQEAAFASWGPRSLGTTNRKVRDGWGTWHPAHHGIVDSHPSRKNKNAARVGHPALIQNQYPTHRKVRDGWGTGHPRATGSWIPTLAAKTRTRRGWGTQSLYPTHRKVRDGWGTVFSIHQLILIPSDDSLSTS
jgi:hypothetical protein